MSDRQCPQCGWSVDSCNHAIACDEMHPPVDSSPSLSAPDRASGDGGIEIRCNADESLDEVCAANFHLEQMSATHWWMAIDDARGSVHVNLHSKATIKAFVDDERATAPSIGQAAPITPEPNPQPARAGTIELPDTIAELQALRGRVDMALQFKVLGDPSRGVTFPAGGPDDES